MRISKKAAFAGLTTVLMLVGGVAVAGSRVVFNPPGNVKLQCTGGMSNHGHEFFAGSNPFGDEPPTGMPVFDGDPDVTVETFIDYDTDFGPDEDGNPIPAGFRVEEIGLGAHAGTHIDVPTHFIEGARTLDDINPEEFVWPVYVIDVRERMQTEAVFQLTVEDIRRYERLHGKIERGSLVVIQTGFEERFGDPSYLDGAPGFAGATVQWMFDNRNIAGTGSDTYGPDAGDDELFDATYTTLLNDGVAVVAMNNLDDLAIRGDLLMAPAVRLREGTGFPVNPISCQGNKSRPRTGPSTVNIGTDAE
ncbi:MAG: cyclase family protein [Acidimicrobiales bacterium]